MKVKVFEGQVAQTVQAMMAWVDRESPSVQQISQSECANIYRNPGEKRLYNGVHTTISVLYTD